MLKSSLAAATTDTDSGKLTSSSSKLNQLLAALGDITATLPAGLTHLGLVGDAAGVKKPRLMMMRNRTTATRSVTSTRYKPY